MLPLVIMCSELLASSLSPSTALHLAVLGEEHQADHLLGASARYIAGNLMGCLSLGSEEESEWMEKVQHSPRLTQGIQEALKLGPQRRLQVLLSEVARCGFYSIPRFNNLGHVVATSANIEFTIKWVGVEEEDMPLFLVAFGLYKIKKGGQSNRVTVEVFKHDEMSSGSLLLFGRLPVELVTGNFDNAVQEVVLKHPVALEPATR